MGTGVVNVVTKSGTNEFHGSASWYFRDKGLNATDPVRKFNGISKESLHVHQFGAQFGGPLHKDKIFFVAAYDGQRRNLGNGAFLSLPAGFQLSSNATTAVFQQRALDYLVPRASPYVQTNNEDSYFVPGRGAVVRTKGRSGDSTDEAERTIGLPGLFIVADGMGGHQAGEQASALAVETIEAFALNTLKWFFLLKGTEEQGVLKEFQAALQEADARVCQQAAQPDSWCSLSVALSTGHSQIHFIRRSGRIRSRSAAAGML